MRLVGEPLVRVAVHRGSTVPTLRASRATPVTSDMVNAHIVQMHLLEGGIRFRSFSETIKKEITPVQ